MPVTDVHPEYEEMLKKWEKCRDAASGEDAIKAKGTLYLDKLGGQDVTTFPTGKVPLGSSDTDYQAYLRRAMFYGAAKRTVKGLAGFIRRKEPDTKAPTSREPILKTIGSGGESLNQVTRTILEDQIKVGRVGTLVDADNDSPELPSILIYTAENITLWRESVISGKRIPTLIVLREDVELPGKDAFGCERIVQYRCLKLGDSPPQKNDPADKAAPPIDYELTEDDLNSLYYYVELWRMKKITVDGQIREEWYIHDVIIPRMKGGKVFREIPFTFINASSIESTVEDPPILDLVNVNLSHYRNSADLEHGRHYSALPTAWVAGFDPKTELRIGSTVAWVAKSESAKAGYLEFTGQGLGHIAEGMKDKERLMAVLGARLLEEDKKAAEAAETVKLRQAGEQSVLANIADAASEGLTRTLRFVWMWMGEAEAGLENYSITLNKDFQLMEADSAVLTVLMQLFQQGAVSWQTLFYNLKRGELIPDNVTEEDEAAKILAGPPAGLPAGSVIAVPGEEEEEEEEPGGPPEEKDAA